MWKLVAFGIVMAVLAGTFALEAPARQRGRPDFVYSPELGPVITETTAGAMATLLHEALHRQGLDDERTTECYANSSLKYAGWNAWWQYVPDNGDASWAASEKWGNWAMKLAFQYSRHTIDASYSMSMPVCLRRVSHDSWADLVR